MGGSLLGSKTMFAVYAELEVGCPIAETYAYLKDRYKTDVYRSVCMMTKGYVPEIQTVEEQENKRLTFYVAGRDALLKFKTPGWRWTYELARLDDHKTKVALTYQWGLLLLLLSAFTIRHQAANELVETALALEALAAKRN